MVQGMLVAAIVATVVTFALCLAFVNYTPEVLLDEPSHRSSHTIPTSRIGGLAVMCGVVAGALTSFQLTLSAAVVIVCGLTLGAVGLMDDRGHVQVRLRLVSQLGVALIGTLALSLVAAGLPLFVVPLVAFAVVGYINAFNFMDGVNGISGINALVAGSAFVLGGAHTSSRPVILLGVLIAAGGLGFLPVNSLGPIFLGDGGSYFLGTLIAFTAAVGIVDGVAWPLMVAPLVIYVVDTAVTLLRRAARGEDLTQAHHEHIYQRLLGGQWQHRHSAVLTAVASGICVAGSWLAILGAPVVGILLVAVAVLGYLTAPVWVDSNRVPGSALSTTAR